MINNWRTICTRSSATCVHMECCFIATALLEVSRSLLRKRHRRDGLRVAERAYQGEHRRALPSLKTRTRSTEFGAPCDYAVYEIATLLPALLFARVATSLLAICAMGNGARLKSHALLS